MDVLSLIKKGKQEVIELTFFYFQVSFVLMQEEIIDPGMDVHTITTTTSNDTGRSRSNMPTFPDPGMIFE